MNSERPEKLDELLENVLSSEDLQPAPVGLRRRVESGLRFVLMREAERKRFRRLLLVLFAAFLLVPTLLFTVALLSGIRAMWRYGLDGRWGHWDYLTAAGPAFLRNDLPGIPLIMLLLLAAGTIAVLLLIPLRRRLRALVRQ